MFSRIASGVLCLAREPRLLGTIIGRSSLVHDRHSLAIRQASSRFLLSTRVKFDRFNNKKFLGHRVLFKITDPALQKILWNDIKHTGLGVGLGQIHLHPGTVCPRCIGRQTGTCCIPQGQWQHTILVFSSVQV